MAQAIVLTGGVSHPFGRAVPVLSDLLAPPCGPPVAPINSWRPCDA